MKTKLIVTGMVALGIGQIMAQTPTPTPEWHVNSVYDWNNMNVPLSTSQWSRTVAPNGDIIIHTYDNWSDITGKAAPAGPTTSLITNMVCQVIGDVQLWQCFRTATPPDGKGFLPPAGLGPCGSWPGNVVITSTIYGAPCPLKLDSFPVEFRYYMATCTGEYKEVGRWNLNKREITGNCNNGYQAVTNRVFISPDCQAGGQGCNGCNSAKLTFDAIGLVCFTQPDDTDCINALHINFSTTSLNQSGSGVDEFYGFPYTWSVTATPTSSNMYDLSVHVEATDTVCGSGAKTSINFVRSGLLCGVDQNLSEDQNDCQTCHDGDITEPGYRCSSAFCGSPYGICNHLMLVNDYVYGGLSITVTY